MVHALEEIHRVLAPGGALIDLRPLLEAWPIELASGREGRTTGRVEDLPVGLEDDAAANAALAQAIRWFVRGQEDSFPLYYSWDSPAEMQEFIEEEWSDWAAVSEAAWRELRAAWASADADARVRVRVKMLISAWRKR